jgi:Mini-chromosome maintenance protein 2
LQEEEGEDLLENAMRDYQRIAILDEYGREGLDDPEYAAVDADARREAERTIRERERRQGGRGEGFYDTIMEQEVEEDEKALQERRRRIGAAAATTTDDADLPEEAEEDEESDLDGDDVFNSEAFDVPLREWIAQDRTRREFNAGFVCF